MAKKSGFQIEWQCSECYKVFKKESDYNKHVEHCERKVNVPSKPVSPFDNLWFNFYNVNNNRDK